MLTTLLENVRFVVIDVETTGGKAGDHRMTEIAMCVVEDDEIVVRYESLINPHQPIPPSAPPGSGWDSAFRAPAEEWRRGRC